MRKGRIKYYFKNKNAVINDVGKLCDMNEQLEQELERLNNIINELEKYIEKKQDRLVEGTSHVYEDSLGKTKQVNEDIFNELSKMSNKLKELKGE